MSGLREETLAERLERLFNGNPIKCSEISPWYNCAAFAIGIENQWWEYMPFPPASNVYWPPTAIQDSSVRALVSAYESLGFVSCGTDNSNDADYDKVAIWEMDDEWAHAARQVDEQLWWSKMGFMEDVQHTLAEIAKTYGDPVLHMRRLKPLRL